MAIQKFSGGIITKVDSHAFAGEGALYIEAIAADETPDVDGEIFDYETSKPNIEGWSKNAADATKASGQQISYGNVRAQHGSHGASTAAGTIHEPIKFDSTSRSIKVGIKVVDADAITKVREGVYTGVSVRGPVQGRKWRDGKHWRYTLGTPHEFSLVDLPANPSAKITVVKASGEVEILDLAEKGNNVKTKKVGNKELTDKSFAYVGDPEQTATWKLPIHDAAHVRNALARYNQTEGIPANKKDEVKARILAAAKHFGIDAQGFEEEHTSKAAGNPLQNIFDRLFWTRDTTFLSLAEKSASANRLQELFEVAGEILQEMTSEEVEELMQPMTTVAEKSAKAAEEEKEAAKAAEAKAAEDAAKKKKEDEADKEAKKGGAFGAAKAAHEKMGDCLSGKCGHKGLDKCAESMKEAHAKMAKHFETSADEAQASKEADAEKGAGTTIILSKGQLDALADLVEKRAAALSTSGRAIPHINGVTVTKSADTGKKEDGDIIEKMAKVDPKSPTAIDERYAIMREGELERM